MAQKLNIRIHAKLQTGPGQGAWTYIVWDGVGNTFGTRRSVKVRGRIDGHPFENSFLPVNDGTHLMGVNAKLRKTLGKIAGDEVSVEIFERVVPTK
ncbi:DUF1905 domain-containing protein [Chitinophaga polysaccharea]|uniref:DUF1905 domain-containing protein n=1 Tax=Chitinophaga TaxID=79328 RepID=UPI001455C1D6|nr:MULTISPECIES: DUF1905 domain-containing protein [Chitinophaga]NLR59229.1 DUF1905 domain-containing protein [Chitinophaga polysaccharea]NLU92002.1 DUF1905 domain-containing protein [Chitinophaga sp. Ak27]